MLDTKPRDIPPETTAIAREGGSRYQSKIDLNELNDPHTIAILSVPPGSRVLDVGCADGDVAAVLAERACTVWGVEIDEVAARRARAHCADVAVGDIESMDLAKRFSGPPFDVILFLDVLEHLRDPEAVLRRSIDLLAETGKVVASIPNVAHGAVRLELLRGRFPYMEKGILDRTHLRFFDRPAVERLFEGSGYTILDRLRVTRLLHETEIDIDPKAFPVELVENLLKDPEALTYQHVVIASPAARTTSDLRRDGTPTLTEQLQDRVSELTSLVRDGEAYARGLEKQLQELLSLREHLSELDSLQREHLSELDSLQRERTYLEKGLLVKDDYLVELRSKLAAAEEQLRSVSAEADALRDVLKQPRHRLADRLNTAMKRYLPTVRRLLKTFTRSPA